MLHLGDFVLQAGDVRVGRGLLRLQFRRVEHCDQIPGFHRRAFVYEQFQNAALDLRTHDHLIRIHRADQHQVSRVIGGEKVIASRQSRR